MVTDKEEQDGIYKLEQVGSVWSYLCLCQMLFFVHYSNTTVATCYIIVLPGCVTDARKHCEVSRKCHGNLVPREAGQRWTGRLPLQSQQPQTEPAWLLPPPAGSAAQPQVSAAESSQQRGWKNDGRFRVAHSHVKLRLGLLVLCYHLPQRDHEV